MSPTNPDYERDRSTLRIPSLPEIEPPLFRNEFEQRAWIAQRRKDQDALRAAWEKFPPGRKFYVQIARGHKVGRRRAGLQFNEEAPTPVEVVDKTPEEILAMQVAGASVVDPLGAAAIHADEVLIVRDDPQNGADDLASALAERDAARRDADAARRETDDLRAQIAKGGVRAEVVDTRSARAKATVVPPPISDDFGGDKKA